MDMAKAFDKVWIDGLLLKLAMHKTPPELVKILRSYLKNRYFTVKLEDKLSSRFKTKAGVPQGSILGPTLFNIYINDIVQTDDTKLAMYADDTVLLSSSSNVSYSIKTLQNAATKIERWCHSWRINMNPAKTVAIMFRPNNKNKFLPPLKSFKKKYQIKPRRSLHSNEEIKRRKFSDDVKEIRFFGENIKWKRQTNYLGCQLDDKLSWKLHIKKRVNQARAAASNVNGLLYSKKVTLKNKILIYNQIIKPMLLYASPAWIGAKPYIINSISSFENATLRKITSMPRYIPNDIIKNITSITPIKDFMMEKAMIYYENQKEISNSCVINSITYDETEIMANPLPRSIIHNYILNNPKHRKNNQDI